MESDINDDEVNSIRSNLLSDDSEDYLVKSIGAFGLWQAGVCVIAALTRYTAMANLFSIVFLTPYTNFVCVEFRNNITREAENSTCYDDCLRYNYNNVVFEETLISEFDLICDKSWMEGFTQTMLMFGFLVGAPIYGFISDRYGRRVAFLSSSFTNIAFMIAAPFCKTYWTFNCVRFFVGISSAGVMTTGIVYILEIVGPQHREIAGSLTLLPDGFTEASLSAIAYYATDWRTYLLRYSVVSTVLVLPILFLPESPRWLVSKGKIEKALIIMTNAAKRNKLSGTAIEANVACALEQLNSIDLTGLGKTYMDLFKTKETASKSICSTVIWTTCALCFFGINQYVTFLGTDIYISVVLLGFVQTPVLPFAIIINKLLGRKISIIISLVTVSVTMTIIIFLEHGHWLCTVIGLIGLAGSCTAFAVLYVYVSELFSTPLRNMAYGLSASGAKVGVMTAPYIALLSPQWIPPLVFAIVPLIALLFCLCLPETKGKQLTDFE